MRPARGERRDRESNLHKQHPLDALNAHSDADAAMKGGAKGKGKMMPPPGGRHMPGAGSPGKTGGGSRQMNFVDAGQAGR